MWTPETEWPEEPGEHRRVLAHLADHAGFFDPRRPLHLARAPGRLDVMGGIADYSGASSRCRSPPRRGWRRKRAKRRRS